MSNTDLSKMSVEELCNQLCKWAVRSSPGVSVSEAIAEIDRRTRVPGIRTAPMAPMFRFAIGVSEAWADGWNACLAKIKEMRDA